MSICTIRRRISVRPHLERQGRRLGIEWAGTWLAPAIDSAFALDRLDALYHRLPPRLDGPSFAQEVLDTFDVSADISDTMLQRVPREGATIVVANHPFGAIEGVLLARLLLKRRSDVRILANHLLAQVEELHDLFIAVDPFGGDGAAANNVAPLRQAVRWLRGGGLLLVFPAGTVSHFHFRNARVIDPQWSPTTGRLVQLGRAAVVPAYIHGRNSNLFQLAGLVHPRLRTALLPRELINKRGCRLQVRLGRMLPFEELAALGDDERLTRHLRLRTDLLAAPKPRRRSRTAGPRRADKIIDPLPRRLLASEIAALPQGQCLAEAGDMQVWYASADQIPWSLQEIGRLRELTFRAAGEGTGRRCDLDRYDEYYLHLLLWDRERDAVAGAYRLGLADQILGAFGSRGLYTRSLFRYRPASLARLMPGIELGRSFVGPEYQRSFAPLLLLWRGIGEFVRRNPQYRFLFGPVSISNSYHPLSRRLLVDFLETNCRDAGLAAGVRPRQPFRARRGRQWNAEDIRAFGDLDRIDDVLSDLETDSKGAPVLLRQYLKLGGRILSFNLDRRFGNALDALIMVDLAAAEPRLLQRYMGREGARSFLAHHAVPGPYRMAS